MTSTQQFVTALSFTPLCLLGLLAGRRDGLNLLRPRVVAPILIWQATFYQIIRHQMGWATARGGFGADYRNEFAIQAMEYVALCLTLFWAGYLVLRPRIITARLRAFGDLPLRYSPQSLFSFSIVFALAAFAICAAMLGPGRLLSNAYQGFPSRPWLDLGAASKPLTLAYRFGQGPLVLLSAAMVGLSWPRRGEAGPANIVARILVLVISDASFMANFSRGAGIPFVAAWLAWAFANRRLPRVATPVVVLLALLAMQASLLGRATVGHSAGIEPWFGEFFHVVGLLFSGNFSGLISTASSLTDSITPLATIFAARASGASLGALSPAKWIEFQIPLPHFIFGGIKDTLRATRFVGGGNSWGYTVGIFGDTYATFGWLGCAFFAFVGGVFRLIDGLVFPADEGAPPQIGPLTLLLPLSYLGLLVGLFNNFRSWLSITAFGTLGLFVLCFILRQFVATASEGVSPAPK